MNITSVDNFLGKPFNIAFYSLLTHAIANQLGLEAGEFIWTGGDCHIYSNHIDQVKLQLTRADDIRPVPTVTFSKPNLSILDMTYDDIEIHGYNPHQAIKAPVAI